MASKLEDMASTVRTVTSTIIYKVVQQLNLIVCAFTMKFIFLDPCRALLQTPVMHTHKPGSSTSCVLEYVHSKIWELWYFAMHINIECACNKNT